MARRSGLSVKALRHYDRVQLLRPAAVDGGSGYRLYRSDQVGEAQLVHLLRSLDLPLEQEKRTRPDDDRMVHIAHASRYHWGQVPAAAEDIAEDEDRDLVLADLETVPGQPRYW